MLNRCMIEFSINETMKDTYVEPLTGNKYSDEVPNLF